jgi:hypothetical protein
MSYDTQIFWSSRNPSSSWAELGQLGEGEGELVEFDEGGRGGVCGRDEGL